MPFPGLCQLPPGADMSAASERRALVALRSCRPLLHYCPTWRLQNHLIRHLGLAAHLLRPQVLDETV